jgi:hypothetical protein
LVTTAADLGADDGVLHQDARDTLGGALQSAPLEAAVHDERIALEGDRDGLA